MQYPKIYSSHSSFDSNTPVIFGMAFLKFPSLHGCSRMAPFVSKADCAPSNVGAAQSSPPTYRQRTQRSFCTTSPRCVSASGTFTSARVSFRTPIGTNATCGGTRRRPSPRAGRASTVPLTETDALSANPSRELQVPPPPCSYSRLRRPSNSADGRSRQYYEVTHFCPDCAAMAEYADVPSGYGAGWRMASYATDLALRPTGTAGTAPASRPPACRPPPASASTASTVCAATRSRSCLTARPVPTTCRAPSAYTRRRPAARRR